MVPLNWETLQIIFPFAIILCGVGLIESLMTLTLIDEITETRGKGNRECIGQGAANVICGIFGGMGGCAMIGQSLINVNSGGRGRLSGITAAVCLLMFVLFLAPLIEQIPMAALVGVMLMVVVGTFEWASLRMFRRMPRSDVLVMVLVAGYTVLIPRSGHRRNSGCHCFSIGFCMATCDAHFCRRKVQRIRKQDLSIARSLVLCVGLVFQGNVRR